MDTRKQTLCAMLQKFIRQRPGLEFGNYGDATSYRAELRSIGKDLTQAQALLHYVELRDSISADDILKAAGTAYSGRLRIDETNPGRFTLDYRTGQYWPTEYRRAVCSVLSSAIWDCWRGKDMPQPSGWRVWCLLDEPCASYGLATSRVFETETEAVSYAATVATARHAYAELEYGGLAQGGYLRHCAMREFGRGIASRWFN